MNKAILIGNLTRDPETRMTSSGATVSNFTVAVTRRFKDQNGERATDYIPVVCWRKTAELCSKYLAKGSKVSVIGEIQTRSYEANDGTERYVTEVIADEVEFLSPKGSTASAPSSATQEAMPRDLLDNGFAEITDADLPF